MSTCAAFRPTSVDWVCVIGIQSCVSPPPLASLLTHTPVISGRRRWLFDFTCPGCTPERTHLFLRPERLFLHFPFLRSYLENPAERKRCVWRRTRKEITAANGLRNVKKGAKEEGGDRTFHLFLPTLELRACVTFWKLTPSPLQRSRVIIEHAEGLSGEKGERFAGKAELEWTPRSWTRGRLHPRWVHAAVMSHICYCFGGKPSPSPFFCAYYLCVLCGSALRAYFGVMGRIFGCGCDCNGAVTVHRGPRITGNTAGLAGKVYGSWIYVEVACSFCILSPSFYLIENPKV